MDDVVAKATVEIEPDLAGFAQKLKADLDAAMGGTDKGVKVKFGADQTPLDVGIAEADAKADAFGRKKEDVELGANDTASKELDKVTEKVDRLRSHLEVLKEAAGGSSGGGIGGLGKGAADAGAGVGGILLPAILTLGSALVPIAGVATGATLALGGMATSAFSVVGAFGLAAIPVFKDVSTAMQQITADTTAVQRALTPTAKATAITRLNDDIKALNPTTAALLVQIDQVKAEFKAWDEQFKPEIMTVFTNALKIVGPLLQDITPLVHAGAITLNQLFATILTGISSPGFKGFIDWLAVEGPHAFMTFISFIGSFLGALGTMFEVLTPFMHSIESGLANLGASFEHFASSNRFKEFVQYVITEGPAVGKFFQQVFLLVERLLTSLAPVGAVMLVIVTDILQFTNAFLQSTGPLGGFILASIGVALALGKIASALKIVELIGKVTAGLKLMTNAYEGIAAGKGIFAAVGASLGELTGAAAAGAVEMEAMRAEMLLAGESEAAIAAATAEVTASFSLLDAVPVVAAMVGVTLAFLAVGAGIYELIHHFGVLKGLMIAGAVAVTLLGAAFVFLDVAMLPEIAVVAAVAVAIAGVVAAVVWLVENWRESWAEVKRIVADVVDWVRNHLALVITAFAPVLLVFGPLILAAYELYTHWKTVWTDIRSIVSEGVAFVKSHLLEVGAVVAPLALIFFPFLTVLALVAGAGYEIQRHWSGVVTFFHELPAVFDRVNGALTGFYRSVATVFTESGGIIQSFGHVVMDVIGPIEHAWDWVAREWDAFIGFFQRYSGEFAELWQGIVQVVEIAVGIIAFVVRPVLIGLVGIFHIAMDAIRTIVAVVWPLITGIIRIAMALITGIVKGALDAVVLVWRLAFGALSAVVRGVFDIVIGAIRAAFIIVRGIFEVALDLLTGHWSRAWDDLWNTVHGALTAVLRGFVQFIDDIIGFLIGAVKDIASAAWEIGMAVIGGIVSALHAGWSAVVNFITGIPGQLWSFTKDAVKWLFETGVHIMEGLLNGLKSLAEEPLKLVKDIGHKIAGAFSDVMGIFSPSKVMHDLGVHVGEGLNNGLAESGKSAAVTAAGIAKSVLDAFGGLAGEKSGVGAVAGLKSLFDDLANAFTSIATAAAAGAGVTTNLKVIQDGLVKLKDVLNAVTNLPDTSGSKDKAKNVGTALSNIASMFLDVSKAADNVGLVTAGALQGITNSMRLIVAGLPWILVGIDLIGRALQDATKPVQTAQWAKKFFGAVGDIFTAFSQPGANWTLVTVAAMQDVVNSLAILALGTGWILVGIEELGKQLHDITKPVQTVEWARKFFNSIGDLFTAFSHPGARWVLVTADAMNDVVNALGVLASGTAWILLGVKRLDAELHGVSSPVEMVAWASKFYKAINDLFGAFSKPGANWVLVTPDATAHVVTSVGLLADATRWILLGLKIVDTALHSVKTPVDTMVWLGKVMDGLHDLFQKVGHAASTAGLANGTATTGIGQAITNIVTALQNLPTAIVTATGPTVTQLQGLVKTMGTLLTSFSTTWDTTWKSLATSVATSRTAMLKTVGSIETDGITKLTTDMATLQTKWDADWLNISKTVGTSWTSMKPSFGAIETEGMATFETSFVNMGTLWGNTWSQMAKDVSSMWLTVQPILGQLQTALPKASGSGVSSVIGNGAVKTLSGTSASGHSTVAVDIAPTIVIDGSKLNESQLSSAISSALDRSNAQLVQLIQANQP